LLKSADRHFTTAESRHTTHLSQHWLDDDCAIVVRSARLNISDKRAKEKA